MGYVRRHWIRGLLFLVVGFYLAIGLSWMFDADQTGGQKVVGALLTFLPAAVLLLSLRVARDGGKSWTRIAIGLALLPTLVFWWMIIPVLAAAAVAWFGIVKGRLAPAPA